MASGAAVTALYSLAKHVEKVGEIAGRASRANMSDSPHLALPRGSQQTPETQSKGLEAEFALHCNAFRQNIDSNALAAVAPYL